jgi:hypothetical protein
MSLFCHGIIGVPGLLLGFTLAMAVTRLEAQTVCG